MTHRLPLETRDVQEMLSSLLLSETPYDQRIRWAQGASLPDDFPLDEATLPALPALAKRADGMFLADTAPFLENMTLSQWAGAITGGWNGSPEKITFFTSGSTGEPVPATHPYSRHEQEILAQAEVFQGRKRIVGFVPRHHIYGFLFSVLLPKALGVEAVWRQPMPTPGLVGDLRAGDLVVAFPLFWEKLMRLDVTFPPGVFGVTSTGPCPAEVLHALRGQGLERMTEVYGSSETGGIGYRHAPTDAYTLLPYWRRTANVSTILRTFKGGATKAFTLQDRLEWRTETAFRPLGRRDKAVQVAGINVYPDRVRDMLLGHPQVVECAVRLMRQEEGTRLKALVVPKENTDTGDLEHELRAWARANLSQYERPGSWSFANVLPKNSMGKTADW